MPKGLTFSSRSGVVIAGYGEQEIYPSVKAFTIDGMANNLVQYGVDEGNSAKITDELNSAIRAFAQNEMVVRFMEGVDPDYQRAILKGMGKLFKEYPDNIVDNIAKLNDKEKNTLKKKIRKTSINIFDEFEKGLQEFRQYYFVNPIMTVVSVLPKNELATMAEALVNITSFKRKVSMQAETVATPIDVALISKGDGFIWIKRKHYFKPELNPQFFQNYYREEEYGEEDREEDEKKE